MIGPWLNLITFCGEEIARQRDSPKMVAPLVEAWMWAVHYVALHRDGRPNKGIAITPGVIEALHALAMPTLTPQARGAWRRVPLKIGINTIIGVPWDEVPRKIANLCEYQDAGGPVEFYREFEEIHPFVDGNGRVGQILYNWRNNTLMEPECAPDLWTGPFYPSRETRRDL